MTDIVSFMEKGSGKSFEDFARENGSVWWKATDLMKLLGYANFKSFNNAIQRAIKSCNALQIPLQGNFDQVFNDNRQLVDYKLSRFACYLTAMNGDTKKPQVVQAQLYFAQYTEAFRQYLLDGENVDRVIMRDDISDHIKTLSGVAQSHGLDKNSFAFFHNEGYRGLYNMNYKELLRIKKVPAKRSLLDFMGRTELAANLFRVTQTEEKIKNENIRGDQQLKRAAYKVGKTVRDTMEEISGVKPEDLRIVEDINKVRSGLKGAQKEFAKHDDKKLKKKKKEEDE